MCDVKLEDGGGACETCLSADRGLAGLAGPAPLAHVYTALLDESRTMGVLPVTDVKICWECRATLLKILRFKLRAGRARQWLEWARTQSDDQSFVNAPSLSSLRMCTEQKTIYVSHSDAINHQNICESGNVGMNNDDTPQKHSDSEYNYVLELNSHFDVKDEDLDYEEIELSAVNNNLEQSNVGQSKGIVISGALKAKNKSKNDTKRKNTKKPGKDVVTHSTPNSSMVRMCLKHPSKDVVKVSTNEGKTRRVNGEMFEKLTLKEEEVMKVREAERDGYYFSRAPFKCDSCIVGFRAQNIYQQHNDKYHSAKAGPYKCPICGRRHRTRGLLDVHRKHHYVQYACKVCGLRQTNWQLLYRHYTRSHEGRVLKVKRKMKAGEMYDTVLLTSEEMQDIRERERQSLWYTRASLKCESCILGFSGQIQLAYHDRTRHSESAGHLICDVCSTRFKSRNTLIKHIRGHYKSYKCNGCHIIFSQRLHAYRHYADVHMKGKVYPCGYCLEVFNKRTEKTLHLQEAHKTFPCTECSQEFKNQKLFLKHMQTHEPAQESPCVPCGTTFPTRKSYLNHYRKKHAAVSPSDAYCVECDKQYATRARFSQHISTTHTYAQRRFECPECGKKFKRNMTMRTHLANMHLRQADYPCQQCDKAFVSAAYLRRHRRKVHEKIPQPRKHVCDICSRGFTQRRILDNHRRTHTGERPYSCAECHAAFTQRVALTYHMRRIHNKQNK